MCCKNIARREHIGLIGAFILPALYLGVRLSRRVQCAYGNSGGKRVGMKYRVWYVTR